MPVLTYLSFGGNCREALDFYRSVFGGEYVRIQTFGDGPPDMGVPDSDRGKIMHATLTVGDGVIMHAPTSAPCRSWATTSRYPTQSKEETDELFAKTEGLQEMFSPTSAPARTGSASWAASVSGGPVN